MDTSNTGASYRRLYNPYITNLSPLLYPLPVEASLSKKAPDFLFGFTGNVFHKII